MYELFRLVYRDKPILLILSIYCLFEDVMILL